MKRLLTLFFGLALVLGTVSTTYAQSGHGHRHGKGGHKGSTRGGPKQ